MDRKISEIRKASDVSVLDNTNQLFVFTYNESSKRHVICFGATGAGKSAGTSEILQSIGAGEPGFVFHDRLGNLFMESPISMIK